MKSRNTLINRNLSLMGMLLLLIAFPSCREEVLLPLSEPIEVGLPEYTSIQGFYLLNEGKMGSNKCMIDYYDYEKSEYNKNIYPRANPNVVMGLGDVGNDLQIYGDKLYAIINCSNKVEVMDKHTVKRIATIDIPNCRYIRFHGGYAYVTSYAGPVDAAPPSQLGYVAKIDTVTFQEEARCIVGYQPDELAIVGNKIYVANSGGYSSPNYETTVSVIDILTFEETGRIEVAKNLHRLRVDRYANLWVSNRGDYYGTPSRLYCIDTMKDQVVDSLDISVSNFWLDGDSLYTCSKEWSYETGRNEISYNIIDVKQKEIVSHSFITDGTDKNIVSPYGIAVNPITKDIYITDAGNYVYTGMLHCFDPHGKQKWSIDAGIIPAHIVFLGKLKE